MGAQHDNSAIFLHNITLWFGCPWTLAVAVVQIGGLAMVAIGLTRMVTAGLTPNTDSDKGPGGLPLCIVGVLGTFLVGYPGYFVFDAIWPVFYNDPIQAGKNAWLAGQGICIAIYLVGLIVAFNSERRALNRVTAN
jgi:hypothetical protein